MNTINLNEFRKALMAGSVEWRKHALQKMAERGLSRRAVHSVLVEGERIQNYAEDRPFPSALFLGYSGEVPVHVVASFDAVSRVAYVITAYIPSQDQFESDHRTRKNP